MNGVSYFKPRCATRPDITIRRTIDNIDCQHAVRFYRHATASAQSSNHLRIDQGGNAPDEEVHAEARSLRHALPCARHCAYMLAPPRLSSKSYRDIVTS